MIHFVFSLLIGLGIYLVFLFLRVLFLRFKKLGTFKSIIGLDNIIRSIAFLLIYLIFLLIIYLSFKRVTVLPIVWLSIFTAIFFCLIPIATLIGKIKNKEIKKIDFLKGISFISAFVCYFI